MTQWVCFYTKLQPAGVHINDIDADVKCLSNSVKYTKERVGLCGSPDIYGTIYWVSSNMVHADCQTLEFFSKEDQTYQKKYNDHALSCHSARLHDLSWLSAKMIQVGIHHCLTLYYYVAACVQHRSDRVHMLLQFTFYTLKPKLHMIIAVL